MKRINIKEGFVGLMYNNGNFKEVLTKGNYWVNPFNTVIIKSKALPLVSETNLDILLKNEKLASMLKIVEVADYEMVIMSVNNNFKEILKAGRYAFWKDFENLKFIKVDLRNTEITEDVEISFLKKIELYPYVVTAKVEANEQAILTLDGKFEKVLKAGTYCFWKKAKAILINKVDMRTKQLEISGQEVLTKDKANLRLNFIAQYKVVDIKKAVLENNDYEKQLYVSIQLAIREFVGTLTLDEILEKKEDLTSFVVETVKSKAENIGLNLIDAGARDIILPGEMKDIINQVLIAQKKAQANTITRREETASTRSLLNTAKLMEDNSMLFKLKEMEYIEKIADKIGEITVNGNGNVIKQLKDIFSVNK